MTDKLIIWLLAMDSLLHLFDSLLLFKKVISEHDFFLQDILGSHFD